ncbi:MAG: tRNA (adenosine(37)-N6)-dimethylallyltransferase MiaA [Bacteroidaceae bacterium]|nr:tRNA (adenosine(37)-N6)-dimethylallyltransferase MiaA [Bacteroidaceae bacterium]
MENKALFVLLGPTAVGKTELALRIAKRLGSPIINADSRQIYKHLSIGTAAPTPEQMQQVKHYFVGTLELEQYFSAALYEQQVKSLLPDLFLHTSNLLLSGGSMLYIDAVCNGIDNIPTVTTETRSLMHQRLESEGLDTLLSELRLLDPEYYAKVDLRNPRRIVHALEICYQTGQPYSSFLKQKDNHRDHSSDTKSGNNGQWSIIKIGLHRERADLFERINRRVDEMLHLGFIEEARNVYPLRHLNSLNTVGYKEMFRYFDNQWTLEQAVEKIKRNTRVYAKKQMTWFKHDPEIHWFHPEDEERILRFCDELKK